MTIMRWATRLQVNVVPAVLWVSRGGSCQVVITPSEYIHCAQVQIKRKHCMIIISGINLHRCSQKGR